MILQHNEHIHSKTDLVVIDEESMVLLFDSVNVGNNEEYKRSELNQRIFHVKDLRQKHHYQHLKTQNSEFL